ncbi:RadC family protein [Cohnella massiliensis]|uniref:RadC family protein n=1 Tax=Cohnella massiliensis TaxID=1816691 RepID=UPI0009B97FF9|nr:DNA repair protein RadC [Cohnella massiliensis]
MSVSQLELKLLLADSLREKPDGYIINQIFNRFRTIEELIDVTEQELLSIRGIGHMKARQIVAALKLARTLTASKPPTNKISSPADVYYLVEPEMRFLKKEHFIVLLLNTKNMVMSKELIAMGSLDACIVHPREVFLPAIKRSCASIICVHNHPSGNPEPSEQDIMITNRLIEAGTIIGIEVLDHVIIGHTFVSLKERGLTSIVH